MELDPELPGVNLALGLAYYVDLYTHAYFVFPYGKSINLTNALACFEKECEVNPGSWQAHALAGRLCYYNSYSEARSYEHLNRAVELGDNSFHDLELAGITARRMKDYRRAVRYLQKLIELLEGTTTEIVVDPIDGIWSRALLTRYVRDMEKFREDRIGEIYRCLGGSHYNLRTIRLIHGNSEPSRYAYFRGVQHSKSKESRNIYRVLRSYANSLVSLTGNDKPRNPAHQVDIAVALLKRAEVHPRANRINHAYYIDKLGEWYLNLYHDPDKAMKYFARAKEAGGWSGSFGMAKIYEMKGEYNKALDEYLKVIPPREKSIRTRMEREGNTERTKLLLEGRERRRQQMLIIRLAHRMGKTELAARFAINSKAQVLRDLIYGKTLTTKELSLTKELTNRDTLQDEIKNLKNQIVQREREDGTKGEILVSLQRDLVVKENEHSTLTHKITLLRKELASVHTAPDISVEELKRSIPEGVTVVEFIVSSLYDGDIHAFLFKGNEVHSYHIPDITMKVKHLRDSLAAQVVGSGSEEETLALCGELYDKLIRPLEDKLKGEVIYICPDAYLSFVPFSCLWDRKDGKFLLEKYRLAHAPSVGVLEFCFPRRRPVDSSSRILALGNPLVKEISSGLRYAEEETRQITASFPQTIQLIGVNASEYNLKKFYPDADVLHFACHTKMHKDDPLLSALTLSPGENEDGQLTAGEIYDFDLEGVSLVTLSACESALGDVTWGSETIGFARSFLYAGSPTVVASLWKVDDRATAELMGEFYRNLKTMTKAEALRQAQLVTMKKHPHPYYWAAFQLIGDWK